MNNYLYKRLEKSILRIYESLITKVSESEDSKAAIEDIEMKIDVIMDALGLQTAEEEQEDKIEDTVDDVVVTTTDETSLDDTTDKEYIDDSTEKIEFVDAPQEEDEV